MAVLKTMPAMEFGVRRRWALAILVFVVLYSSASFAGAEILSYVQTLTSLRAGPSINFSFVRSSLESETFRLEVNGTVIDCIVA